MSEAGAVLTFCTLFCQEKSVNCIKTQKNEDLVSSQKGRIVPRQKNEE